MSQFSTGLPSDPPRRAGQNDAASHDAEPRSGFDDVSRRSFAAFWLVFAFVTWNVIFDRHVSVAAVAFTREQTGNHLAGRPRVSIADGFTPHVQAAAARASLWAGAIVILGAAVTLVLGRKRTPGASNRPPDGVEEAGQANTARGRRSRSKPRRTAQARPRQQ